MAEDAPVEAPAPAEEAAPPAAASHEVTDAAPVILTAGLEDKGEISAVVVQPL